MVARGAGAAGPVLLACRQWDPLGLARRLPSLGVGAWRCAPLLPWRVQCPVRVCAALAAGSGGSGRYLVLCLSRFPHPAPRVPRCVWRAVPSGCPLPSLAGTPFHAVCAFRVLGPVAPLLVPACPLRVCALALPRRPLPPPLGGVACAPRAVPALGAGRAVPRGPCPSACPAPVPCSVWRAWGGAVRSRFPPSWLLSGATPPPTARPLGGLLGSATHVLWARVSPWPACPVGAACRGGGVVGERPRGGVACNCCEGRLVSGAAPPPTARPLGGLPGPPTHWLWVRGGAGVGTHHQPHRARSYELALRAVGAARGRPGEGASCLGVGRPGSGALPPPTARPLGGLPWPTTHWLWVRGGAGVGTRHQPHSARPCVLWGRHDGARGGHLLPGCGVSGVGRSSTPDCPPSGRAAGAHYPLAVGAGGCGRGDPSPTPQRALLQAGFARCGGGTRAHGGGASCLGLGRPVSGALPPPTARPLGGLPGPTTHWLWVQGVREWGAVTKPTARAFASWLCALWGRHEGARGGRLLPGCGASGVGRSPNLDCPPSGPAAGAHYPLAVGTGGCGRGDPSPNPRRALLRAGFARCGGGMRVPGGDTCCLGVGRPGLGALPPPTARPLGGLPGPTTHWLWVGEGAGVGTRHQPHSARSFELALRAMGAARGRPGGGGASCLGVGRPGSGALPAPTARPLHGLPRPTTHWLWVRGGAAVGTRHQPHSARFFELALRAVGAA